MKLVIPTTDTSTLPNPLTQIESKNKFNKIHPNETKVGMAILNKAILGFSTISATFSLVFIFIYFIFHAIFIF